jgi:hypothetical protein
VKENSPATRITRDGKIKLQTQQEIGDFPMGKLNEKITTGRGKKLKIDKGIDVQVDLDIKEKDEHEDYTTSLVQSPAKQKK